MKHRSKWYSRSRANRKKDRWWENCDCACDLCDLPFCDLSLVSFGLLAAGKLGGRPGRAGAPLRDRAALSAIRAYRKVSPRLPTRCRFTPTCSAYGHEAISRYGLRRGSALAAARVRRCRPGVRYGTPDPVP
ncbi:membrane protein insertion efficiency factor YidD [Krasilnikovia sp. M28-CT-15]|uniref:membrane protein insertion efficiency factor YidD n=1 Tax=Krasilnikovia sp. M28-CT-15 TaxID=3373540 RepID=UPI00399D037C